MGALLFGELGPVPVYQHGVQLLVSLCRCLRMGLMEPQLGQSRLCGRLHKIDFAFITIALASLHTCSSSQTLPVDLDCARLEGQRTRRVWPLWQVFEQHLRCWEQTVPALAECWQ